MDIVVIILAESDVGAAMAQHTTWFTAPIALSSLSICIALAAITIAFLNFRLSRFPHVRARFRCYFTNGPKGSEHRFEAKIESWGLPIWDMKVVLEADYRAREYMVDGQMTSLMLFAMEPVGTLPQPMNAGQVMKFRITAEKEVHSLRFKRTWGISDLPLDRVRVAVYGSGERLIKAFPSTMFPFGFNSFDHIGDHPPRRKGKEVNVEKLHAEASREPKPFEYDGGWGT